MDVYSMGCMLDYMLLDGDKSHAEFRRSLDCPAAVTVRSPFHCRIWCAECHLLVHPAQLQLATQVLPPNLQPCLPLAWQPASRLGTWP